MVRLRAADDSRAAHSSIDSLQRFLPNELLRDSDVCSVHVALTYSHSSTGGYWGDGPKANIDNLGHDLGAEAFRVKRHNYSS